MPPYMTQFSYTSEAWAAFTENPEDRSDAVRELVENVGGRLICFYHCGTGGEYDGVMIYEVPDESALLAAGLAAASPGHIGRIKTTALLTAEDAVEAMRKAHAMMYRGPGR